MSKNTDVERIGHGHLLYEPRPQCFRGDEVFVLHHYYTVATYREKRNERARKLPLNQRAAIIIVKVVYTGFHRINLLHESSASLDEARTGNVSCAYLRVMKQPRVPNTDFLPVGSLFLREAVLHSHIIVRFTAKL